MSHGVPFVIQWNPSNIDPPGNNQTCPDNQGALSFQVNLCTKGLLWDLNSVCGLCRCPHVHINRFTVQHGRVSLY